MLLLPAIPLWYQNGFGGYSKNVSDVVFDWHSVPVYSQIKTTAADGVVLANGTEPQNPLVPSNTNEVGGGRIVDLVFSGLVSYKADGSVVNEIDRLKFPAVGTALYYYLGFRYRQFISLSLHVLYQNKKMEFTSAGAERSEELV